MKALETRMCIRRTAWLIAASLVSVLSGCVGSGSQDVLAQVDAIDSSCAHVSDPILLVDAFRAGGVWMKAPAANLVAAEIGRESHPQDRVVVGAPEAFAESIRVRPVERGVISKPFHVREDRFQALEAVASLGGPVYFRVFDQTDDRASVNWLAWVDSVGGVHFLGGCAPALWTEPLGRFTEDIEWRGTQEKLLLALINREPELEALRTWTYGPSRR